MATFPSADVPLVLLPVRLETRFRGDALLVRIFPDELHVTSHQEGLSQAELDAGVRYFESKLPQAEARRELDEAVGAARAQWVLQALAAYPSWRSRGRSGPAPLPKPVDRPRRTRALGLPSRFRVVGFLGADKVLEAEGAPVSAEPVVVPRQPEGELPFDADTRWLHDFDAATSAGLAVSIPLGARAADIRSRGLTRLIAFGVAEEAPEAGAARLTALLTAQRFDRGASFMPVGTPTNHMPGAVAGAAPAEAKNERAARLAAALGIPAKSLELALAGGQDEAEARALHTALWPATLGAWLSQWMGAGESTRAWVRRHFIEHVRPLGPLPALRIGSQPYGVLPVTLWRALKPTEPAEGELLSLLGKLRAGPFGAALAALPRVTEAGADGILRALARTPVTHRLGARPLFGRRYLRNLYQMMRPAPPPGHVEDLQTIDPNFSPGTEYRVLDVSPPLPWTADAAAERAWLDGRQQFALLGLHNAGLSLTPRLSGAVFADEAPVVKAPLAGVDPFVAGLAQANVAGLRGGAPATLLGQVLRLAGLRAALELGHQRAGRVFDEAEWLTESPLAIFSQPLGAQTVEQFLDAERAGTGTSPALAEWREWWQAARLLAGVPADRLELGFGAAFDALSHRLDAWWTAFASRRLQAVRQKRPAGLALGAFGWVENLLPASAAPSAGYVHAPSQEHAATAALLAAGYRAHRAFGNAFQIDLSSARVRRALRALEAAEGGRPLGAVLGEQLERRLIELGKGGAIAGLRSLAPPPKERREPQVDGLRLAELYRAGTLTTQATLEAFVNVESIAEDWTSILNHWANGPQDHALLGLMRDGRLAFAWQLEGAAAWGTPEWNGAFSTTPVPAGRWVHVAVVRDGARLSFFVDGQPAGVAAMAVTPFVAPGVTVRLGGQQRGGTARNFRGTLREVRLWSVARSPADVLAAAQGRAGGGPALVAYWPLDEASGDACRDAVGRRDGLLGVGCERVPAEKAVRFDGSGFVEIGGSQDLRVGWVPGIAGASLESEVLLEIDRLADTSDAMADLVVAESMHQWVGGRLDKAGALVAAYEEGRGAPAQFDVLETRRSQKSLVHRVMVLRGKERSRSWPAPQLRARISASLERLASELLGPWHETQAEARYLDERGGLVASKKHPLSAAKLSTLDVVFGCTASGVARPDELTAALSHQLFTLRPAALSKAARVEVAWSNALDELLEAACVAWRAMTAGRALRAEDVTWPPRERDASADAASPAAEAERVLLAAVAPLRVLAAGAGELTPAQAADARAALFAAWCAGLSGSVAAPETSGDGLRALARRAGEELDRRLAAAAGVRDSAERLELLVGNSFRFLAPLQLSADEAKALDAAAFDEADDRTAARRWFRQAARAREALGYFSDALLCQQASAPGAARFETAQLPRAAGERWAGLNAGTEAELSLVAHLSGGLAWKDVECGLLLDSFTERLPAKEQPTAISFHYDAPGAAPPHAILLAVCPDDRPAWDADLVAEVVQEALELGKLRGVAYADVPQTHHYLPAVVLPHNAAGETPSVDPFA
ncbi:MAG: LamG domain-containing protein [Myxococcales bacterium]|nr:LamG domain-containing protein [Myxococcales bacterium]